jgi:4-diphosphocytidyl-2-C-methyl-D-erythritol kinase
MIAESAPAKINLYLHIGPLRPDGLHELASLFVFAEGGDEIRAEKSSGLSLQITGPYAPALAGEPIENNLVLRAAKSLQDHADIKSGAAITLEKSLPVAAGVGGGSADAAAALRALIQLWNIDISEATLARIAFKLGADVPACLARAPVNVSGAGEKLELGPRLPPLWCCLVNPGVPMPTGPVFRAFDRGNPAPQKPAVIRMQTAGYETLVDALSNSRNDLESYACDHAPVIRDVISMLAAAPGALLARMSGSGATCFSLFSSGAAATRAARKATGKGWWAMASPLHVR